jgi:hypothetical protein
MLLVTPRKLKDYVNQTINLTFADLQSARLGEIDWDLLCRIIYKFEQFPKEEL